MAARYKSHNDATLSFVEDTFCHFHAFKDVFLLGRGSTNAKEKLNSLKIELVNKRKLDKETNAEIWSLTKTKHEMNAWRDYLSLKIGVSKQLDANFNFLTIHLMCHLVEQIL